jgi:hypothetical protein
MASRRSAPRHGARWGALAAALLFTVPASVLAEAGQDRAPDWPNLLSEAGRRAAMGLAASSPWHLEPTLADLEDAERRAALPSLDAKARYDAWRLTAGAPPNVRANDPTGDQTSPAADTQSECAVAAHGNNVVVAWNDSKGLRLAGVTISSYAYSCDGGQTFTDGGNVPLLSGSDQSYGDCTLDVDNSGNFYLGAIYVSGGVTQDVAVSRGTFSGCSFSWNPPVIAASGATGAIDKPYLCVNPVDGNVYVSYTRFGAGTTIEVVRGTALGTSWNTPVVLESASGIQGSRPIVGPEGNLYVCWQAGWGTINCDLSSTSGSIRLRRSTNPAGAFTFNAAITVGTAQHNWTSYWAGNLRNNALYFPDIAVDRSGGTYNGRVYVCWNEAAPWGAPTASGTSSAETESNNTPSDAGVKTINPGDNATGTISSSGDFDYWRISVTAGQHVMMRLEPQGFNCGVTGTTRNFQIRLFKGIAGTSGDSILANSNLNQFASEIVFDVPETATYLFRVRNVNSSGTVTGTYTVKSRLLTYGTPGPARDMRDVVCARSTNQGQSFLTEVLVNNDAANLDNCIPAATVDQDGCLHVYFYDVRDAAGARILRSYYDGVSTDGGASFAVNHRVSDELNYFNLNTVAVPNYGEYNQACTARGVAADVVYATWSDERISHAGAGGSGVDAYVAKLAPCVTVTCEPDQTAASGAALNLNLCVNNCGNYADDIQYTITDTQGWVTGGGTATITVASGGSTCIPIVCTIPPGTPDGTTTVITLTARSVTCPGAAASCTTTITVQNPIALPPAGEDCFQSTAVVTVEIFGVGTETLNLSGPTRVQRHDPFPSGPGYLIETEMVALELTGVSPLMGPVTLVESSLYASGGEVQTPALSFFPAESFFDVYFEIQTGTGTLFNKNRYHMAATINAIPPVGDPFSGGELLLYRHGTDEATPVGRIISVVHTPGPPWDCLPLPGVDCMGTQVDMTVDIIGVGTDNLVGYGSTVVSRGPAVDPGDGRPQIATEMLSMDLTGNGTLVGPFRLTESLTSSSTGQSKSQVAGQNYPMDSFFDVFFEVELPNFGTTAIGVGPAQMTSVIHDLPPLGSIYQNTAPVQLIDKFTLQPLGTLLIVRHTPQTEYPCAPPAAIDCFDSTAEVTVEIFGVGTDLVSLAGGTTLVARGPLYDGGGGQLVIDTEMLAMELTGVSPVFGPVTVEEDPARASQGRILGSAPGVIWPADGYFDVFLVLKTLAGSLRLAVAVHVDQTALGSAPPLPGTPYAGTNLPIDLVDYTGAVRGRLHTAVHFTGQPCPQWPTDTPLDREENTFFALRAATPNPFTGQTSVSFRLDRERHVRMRVYNVRGELVRTVYDASLGAGPQVLEWDGKAQGGRAVGAGVYFYRIEIDARSVTRKVIKLR